MPDNVGVDALALVVVVLLTLGAYIVLRARRSYTNVPGPRGWPLVGNIPDVADFTKLHEQLSKWHRSYGSVVAWTFGPQRFMSVTDPEMVEAIIGEHRKKFTSSVLYQKLLGHMFPCNLISLQGQRWMHVRLAAQGAIAGQKSERLLEHVQCTMSSALELLEKTTGAPTDMYELFGKVLFDAFGRFGYGHAFETLHGHNLDLLEAMLVIGESMIERQAQPFAWLWRLPTRRNRQIAAAVRRTRGFIERLVSCRREALRAEPPAEGDVRTLLDALILRDAISHQEVVDNIALFFIGSFDTTSNTLCYILHHLAAHPHVLQRLQAEVDAHAPELDGNGHSERTSLRSDAFRAESMPLLDCVCREAIRLLPTAYAIPRTALEELSVNGWRVPKDTLVLLNVYEMARIGRLWPGEPEDLQSFRPERWLEMSAVDKSVHMPFGTGSRMCIGNRIALLEMKLITAMLVRAFDIAPVADRPLSVSLKLALSPADGAWFTLTRRRELLKTSIPGNATL